VQRARVPRSDPGRRSIRDGLKIPTRYGPGLLILALVVIAIVLLPHSSIAALPPDQADILLLENTSRLRVLDRYQRSVSSPEEAGITGYTPIVMRNSRDMLSDGFTPCARVEVDGNLFFLLRGSDSRLVGADSFGYQAFYRRASILKDTIEVLRGNRLLIQSVRRTDNRYLSTGERLERIFVHEGLTYVRRVEAAEEVFGWVTFGRSGRGSIWRAVTTESRHTRPQTADAVDRVESVVQEANTILGGLYEFMNRQTGQKRTAPRWEVTQAGDVIICVLRSESPPSSFRETTSQLARSLEAVVLSTHRRVVAQPGRIELR
jgi:hypothetical protein